MKDRRTATKSNLPEGEKQLDVWLGKYVREKLKGLYIKMGTTYMSGLPDRLVIIKGYKPIFIELKGKGNKPSIKQLAVHKVFANVGIKVYVLTGCEPKKRVQEILDENEDI